MLLKIFRRRGILIWTGILLASLILTFLKGGYFQPPANSKAIIIGYSNYPSWWTWIIAEEQNLFAANNLNVKLKWYDNYSDSVRDFKLGLLDANSEVVVGEDRIKNLKNSSGTAVLLNNYSTGEDQLIVKPEIRELQDLENKTIISESDAILNLFLDNSSIREKIDISTLEAGLASAAFVTDSKIDGVLSYPPYSEIALKSEGSRMIASSADFSQQIARMLIVKDELVSQSSEVVENLKTVWFDALSFLQNNPVESQEIIANRLNLDVFQVAKAQNQIVLADQKDNSLVIAKNNKPRAK